MAIHNCPDCGLVHEVTESRESPEVAIARINADNALAIAKLQARADRDIAETVTEAEKDMAETDLETAVAEAELLGAAIEAGDVEPEPIVIQDPEPAPEVTDETVPPDADEEPGHHAATKRGMGMWG